MTEKQSSVPQSEKQISVLLNKLDNAISGTYRNERRIKSISDSLSGELPADRTGEEKNEPHSIVSRLEYLIDRLKNTNDDSDRYLEQIETVV